MCCMDSKIAGPGVSPESLISAPRGVMGSAPRIDLACRLRRSWRSSRLPASLGSHQSSLPYSATAWTHATWTALTLSGTTPYVVVRVRSLASAALAFFMHRLWCSLSVRCTSIQTPSQRVACLLNHMNPSPTFIFADSFGRRCFLWPRLRVNPGSRCVGKRGGGNTSPDNLPFGVVIVLLLANNVYTELLSYICSVKKCLITTVFLSGQAGLSGGFQMRAGLQTFLGGLSLNRIFCSKGSLLPLLRKSQKYET